MPWVMIITWVLLSMQHPYIRPYGYGVLALQLKPFIFVVTIATTVSLLLLLLYYFCCFLIVTTTPSDPFNVSGELN